MSTALTLSDCVFIQDVNLMVLSYLLYLSATLFCQTSLQLQSFFFFFASQIPSDKLVKVLSILEKNIQDGAKLSTLMNHVSVVFTLPFTIRLWDG